MILEKKLGIELAKEKDIKADLVIPVPDSGVPAALGFAEYSKKRFELGLIRNHYVGRTFIEPTQSIRSLGVKLKLSPTKSIVKNKSIIFFNKKNYRNQKNVISKFKKKFKVFGVSYFSEIENYKKNLRVTHKKSCVFKRDGTRCLWSRFNRIYRRKKI